MSFIENIVNIFFLILFCCLGGVSWGGGGGEGGKQCHILFIYVMAYV